MPAPSHPPGRRAAVPSRTPPARIASLNATMNAVLNLPLGSSRFRILGIENRAGTPEQLAAAVQEESERWGPVILRGGISIQ